MKAKTILLTLALYFAGAVICFAQDANMGTWKLNEAKSKLAPGAQEFHRCLRGRGGQCESHDRRHRQGRVADA